jgi:hypothetical protein
MKKSILSVSLSLLTSVCAASNPASTAYVDKQFAGIQTQFDAIKANPTVAHPVGSCYGGGVVYYVNTDPTASVGNQGLIAALSDAGNLIWSNTIFTPTLAIATTYFTGAANTSYLVDNYPSSDTEAAYAAHNYSGGGESDWYLPAQDELMTLYTQWKSKPSLFTQCGGTDPSTGTPNYWSSSQFATAMVAGSALYVEFRNGFVGAFPMAFPNLVRSVRAF